VQAELRKNDTLIKEIFPSCWFAPARFLFNHPIVPVKATGLQQVNIQYETFSSLSLSTFHRIGG
jgi:hypothetical protein